MTSFVISLPLTSHITSVSSLQNNVRQPTQWTLGLRHHPGSCLRARPGNEAVHVHGADPGRQEVFVQGTIHKGRPHGGGEGGVKKQT